MITPIPIKMMEASRTVVLKHPNSLECAMYRKVLLRTAPETMGGLPTMGGMGVLKGDDEAEFEYQLLGPAKMLITSKFVPDDMTDRGDAVIANVPELDALVACTEPPGFEIKKNDLVCAMPGGGVTIAFELVGVVGEVNIHPYATKWIISPRDDLHNLEPWQP